MKTTTVKLPTLTQFILNEYPKSTEMERVWKMANCASESFSYYGTPDYEATNKEREQAKKYYEAFQDFNVDDLPFEDSMGPDFHYPFCYVLKMIKNGNIVDDGDEDTNNIVENIRQQLKNNSLTKTQIKILSIASPNWKKCFTIKYSPIGRGVKLPPKKVIS